MLMLREATLNDLDFLVEVDLRDEGITSTQSTVLEPEELINHRKKITAFLVDKDKAAWVYEDTATNRLIGMIMWRYRNRLLETFKSWEIFGQLDESLFPADGAFCEIFQLWIAPDHRRQGLATRLKQQAEQESLLRDIHLIYTHTEEVNLHVIEMNQKLGYREVRRGPIWDELIRVSLIKPLPQVHKY